MEVTDLTHFISEDMPVYPGTVSPVISVSCSVERDGFSEKLISMSSHTGTHMDAPAHMIAGGKTLDQFDADYFTGPGYTADIAKFNKPLIDYEDIEPEIGIISKMKFVLFYTGWSGYWGNDKYFRDFPVLSPGLVKALTGLGLNGIGIDCISIDPVGSADFLNHKTVFERSMIIIENLTNLEKLIGKEFLFICSPLKIREADGSPVRALAIIGI
jgi:kynurenine formamidase